MSLIDMRAHAARRGWPVEIERVPADNGELLRLWSTVDGERMMADGVAAPGEADTVLDGLAARFLYWWRSDEARPGQLL